MLGIKRKCGKLISDKTLLEMICLIRASHNNVGVRMGVDVYGWVIRGKATNINKGFHPSGEQCGR